MNHRPLLFLLLCCAALPGLGGCSKRDDQAASVKPAVAVDTASAAVSTLIEAVAVTGTLTAKSAANIKSELAGLYREVYVTEWVAVRKGQPLALIQAAESETMVKRAEAGLASSRAALLQARVEADRGRREAERMGHLQASGLATRQQLDDAGSAVAAAEAGVAAAQAGEQAAAEELAQLRIRLGKSLVRAPIDGVVAERHVNVGDLSGVDSGGKTIFRIVDNRRLDLTVTVPTTELARVAVGQTLEFTCDGYPGETFAGVVKHLNPSVNPGDRSLQIMAEVDNRDGRLRDGLFVKGSIVTGRREGVLLVPRVVLSGLDLSAGRAVLFVIEAETARRREVKTGAVSGEQVEIVTGLQAGERYVTRGAFNLRDGDRVSAPAPTGAAKP